MISRDKNSNKIGLDGKEIAIRIENLDKTYPKITALSAISLDIYKGEVFCLIGPNGAGKSTIVNLITGQIKPTGGRIFIHDLDPIKNRKELTGKFGLVPQEIALYYELTGLENLKFHGKLYSVPKRQLDAKVDELLAIAGLTERKNDKVATYSGGMKRRLQLVRAMVHEPDILILDEPTLGVDVQTRSAIHQYILDLAKKGITIIVTTNYMEEAEKLSDRLVILDNKIVIGPSRIRDIQETVFPHSIFEFKLEKDKLSDNFREEFILKHLKGEIMKEESLSQKHIFFEISVKTKDLKEILAEFLKYFTSRQIKVEEIVLKKPTLEDIFLKLTGKEFRE